jgi:hypothetical protein
MGTYEVLSLLGRGAMGLVLKAFDTVLHRTVAIKVLAPQLAASEKAQRRFLREARAAAGINHPNVVTIHAVDEQGGLPYLVMEFVPGVTLRQRIRQGKPFDLASLLRIGAQVAAGLAAAHQHGVIHRDIKPTNIMLEDGIERVKITDFGLALVIMDISKITSLGLAVGTPAYMSPEQVAGEPLDPRSDLFSLGCVLYSMVTGKSPFQGNHALEVARKVTDLVPRPLQECAPAIPRFLSDLVARLLAKRPADRYQSAEEVRDLLQRQLAQVHQGQFDVLTITDSLPVLRRHRRWLTASATAALVLILGTFLLLGLLALSRNLGGAKRAPDEVVHRDEITVARTGGAEFSSLAEALAHAGPGTRIRILDGAVYQGPVCLDDAERHAQLTIEAPQHAILENAGRGDPVVSVTNTPGITLRGVRIRTRDRQHALSVRGDCRGLTIDQVRITTPAGSPFAAVVLWPGTSGSADRPVTLRQLEVQCGEVGVAVLGQDGQPTAWVQIQDSRFTGPGCHLTLETAVQDITVRGNIFSRGACGVSVNWNLAQQAQRLNIEHNTFFGLANWLAFSESSLDQKDVAIANNLILQTKGIQTTTQDLTQVAGQWFHDNWWELGAGADPDFVRRVAEPRNEVALLSRDPSNPDFLRPRDPVMPNGAGAGNAAYVGALVPRKE